MATRFGEMFARLRRERRRQSLREFCATHNFDPGNVSKLERGRLAVPESQEVLERYAGALGLEPGSDEWTEFMDVAAAERGRIPPELLSDEEMVGKLPVLFRTLRGDRVSPEELEGLMDVIRRA